MIDDHRRIVKASYIDVIQDKTFIILPFYYYYLNDDEFFLWKKYSRATLITACTSCSCHLSHQRNMNIWQLYESNKVPTKNN